jgi:hypothetical protein
MRLVDPSGPATGPDLYELPATWPLIDAGIPKRQPVHDAESSEVGTGDGGSELAAAAEPAIA